MKLIKELKEHLSDMKVAWHLCGGFAIDVFLGKETREHKDLDITVSFTDIRQCVNYLCKKGWRIVAPIGGGRFLPIGEALESDKYYFDNIWCYRDNADFIKVKDNGPFLNIEMEERNQSELDFIEVLFNKVDESNFYYLKNPKITLDVDKSVLNIGGVSILSPELILLYKTRNPENSAYQQDFKLTIAKLQNDEKNWLIESMRLEYPQGHPWMKS